MNILLYVLSRYWFDIFIEPLLWSRTSVCPRGSPIHDDEKRKTREDMSFDVFLDVVKELGLLYHNHGCYEFC
jgi:hypothetical protein